MNKMDWSSRVKEIARRAFDAAYFRECMAAHEVLCKTAAEIDSPTDLWRLFLRLTEKRAGAYEKRDRSRSVLPPIFARSIRVGWTGEEDPAGLSNGRRGYGQGRLRGFGVRC